MFDGNGRMQAALANPVAAGGQHAGPAAAQFLAGQCVGLVAAGEFGPRFLEALEAHGIRHALETGRVADVITRLVAR
jgi:predicted Fe-Mo cluster-binding NifX family protein